MFVFFLLRKKIKQGKLRGQNPSKKKKTTTKKERKAEATSCVRERGGMFGFGFNVAYF
jgi:hypothetical protein